MNVECSQCGKPKGCSCDAPYVPAGTFAAKINNDPELAKLSNRAVAEKLGVSNQTVMRARKATAPNGAVEERTGKDGKKRRMPKRKGNGGGHRIATTKASGRKMKPPPRNVSLTKQTTHLTKALREFTHAWRETASAFFKEHKNLNGDCEQSLLTIAVAEGDNLMQWAANETHLSNRRRLEHAKDQRNGVQLHGQKRDGAHLTAA
jgi:hypothetical protein